jgi:hypothetical protein
VAAEDHQHHHHPQQQQQPPPRQHCHASAQATVAVLVQQSIRWSTVIILTTAAIWAGHSKSSTTLHTFSLATQRSRSILCVPQLVYGRTNWIYNLECMYQSDWVLVWYQR